MELVRSQNGNVPAFDLWNGFFNSPFRFNNGRTMAMHTAPAVNIRETGDEFILEVAAPGLTKDNFKVEVDQGQLHISSVQQEDTGDVNANGYTRREFFFGAFHRTFSLPGEVRSEEIQASYTDGILTVKLPKKEEARRKPPRLIKVG